MTETVQLTRKVAMRAEGRYKDSGLPRARWEVPLSTGRDREGSDSGGWGRRWSRSSGEEKRLYCFRI